MANFVKIDKEKLATVLAYLATHPPSVGPWQEYDDWTRCMNILSARRGEAEPRAKWLCADCEWRGNCNEDTLPGGCIMRVGKPEPKAQDDGGAMGTQCNKANWCHQYAPVVLSAQNVTTTIPNARIVEGGGGYVTKKELGERIEYSFRTHQEQHLAKENATKTDLDGLTKREEDLERRVWDMQNKMEQMDDDHVALLKCYTYHLTEQMPTALRDAGEAPAVTKEELDAAVEAHRHGFDHPAYSGLIEGNVEALIDGINAETAAMEKHEKGHQHWSQDVLLDMVAKVANGAMKAHGTEYHADVAAWRKARSEGTICGECAKSQDCALKPLVTCAAFTGSHPK